MLCALPRLEDASLASVGPEQTTLPPPSFVGPEPGLCGQWARAI